MSYSSAAQAKPRATAAPVVGAAPVAVASTAAPVAVAPAARHEPLNSFNSEEVAQHLQNGKDLSLFQLILGQLTICIIIHE